MNIESQFNRIAEEYDVNRRKFIPCFDDFYKHTTAFLASNLREPEEIVDLGAGTGLLSCFWYAHFPRASYLLVDIAEDMLSVARKRFSGAENVSYQVSDYTERLPGNRFDTVISALSVHHLENTQKEALFSRLYSALPKGGLFVNYDQFCAGEPLLNEWYDRFWEGQLYRSGLSEKDLALWQGRRALDRECAVEQETQMLKESGFSLVKCVYTYQKFSVIVAIK